MSYLLAKYTLIFLLTALLSFLLGHWWSRRRFEDVTQRFEEISNVRADNESAWSTLWARLDSMDDTLGPSVRAELANLPKPAVVDLSGLENRMNDLSAKVEQLPPPTEPDLGEVFARLAALDSAVTAIPTERLSLSSVESGLGALTTRFAQLPQPQAVDLSDVTTRIDALSARINALPTPKEWDSSALDARLDSLDQQLKALTAQPSEAVDLNPIVDRLNSLQQDVNGIELPATPEPVNVEPLQNRLSAVETAIKAIRLPEPARPNEPIDLGPLHMRLEALEAAIGSIKMPKIPAPVDYAAQFTGVNSELSSMKEYLQRELAKLAQLATAADETNTSNERTVDLAPLGVRIAELDRTVRGLPKPIAVDLSATNARLVSIEGALGRLSAKDAPRANPTPEPVPGPMQQPEGLQLFTAPVHGAKDDLKKILGVGPKLEGLLNDNGVYYFWQVASWSPADITFVDEQLDVFKGRIARDEWVRQAQELKLEAGAAAPPSR